MYLKQLVGYLQIHLCLTAKQVAHYVQETWLVSYSERGITQLLHRLGFVYKKPKLPILDKADTERQSVFVEEYRKRHEAKKTVDRTYFMDATHPHHSPIAGYGRIKTGQATRYATIDSTRLQRSDCHCSL